MVLGGGGSVGVAYHGGVVAAIADVTGWDPRSADVVLGTSAGALTGALLRLGLPAADLRCVSEDLPLSDEGDRLSARGQAHRPRVFLGDFVGLRPMAEPRAALRGLLTPWRHNPLATLAAFLPEGPVPTDAIAEGLDAIAGGTWPAGELWIPAVSLRDGRQVVFGRPGAPRPPLGLAVAASCAIPGYYSPVTIGAARFVDGGVASMHGVGILAGEAPDLIIVSAPLAYGGRRPRLALDGLVRHAVRAQLEREVAALRKAGSHVVTLMPDRRVAAAMGNDPMDARRRGAVSRMAYAAVADRLVATPEGRALAGALGRAAPAEATCA